MSSLADANVQSDLDIAPLLLPAKVLRNDAQAINAAHELGHKKESVERWLSKIVLAQSAYGHFYLEHNRGHHVRVSTPEDPATSRFGETLYGFWPRSVGGGLKSAWHL